MMRMIGRFLKKFSSLPAILLPQYFDKPVINFFNRLKKVQQDPMDSALAERLSREDFHKILDFFLDKQKREQFRKMAALAEGEAYRLDKHDTALPRTLNVLRSPQGEFLLMLETKRKLADGTKDESLVQVCGIAKCGKPAWRTDIVEEYFNLVMRLEKEYFADELADAKAEVALSQKYSPQLIVHQLMGPLYYSYKELEKLEELRQPKLNVYGKKGEPLEKFIRSGKYAKLSEAQKRKMTYQLFLLVKELHDDDCVYQDLKFENIIVYEENGGFYIKLTDLGHANKHNDTTKVALASDKFQSPEISYYHSQDTPWHDYYHGQRAKSTLGNQLEFHCAGDQKKYKAPHKANDLWALGIAVFYLRFGFYPQKENLNLIKEDDLLKGLLEPNRDKRLDIKSALRILSQNNNKINSLRSA